VSEKLRTATSAGASRSRTPLARATVPGSGTSSAPPGADVLSDIGYHQIDHIRLMRNYVSAADPNADDAHRLSARDWLETCIREVITFLTTQSSPKSKSW
jgi:hypothetical protein